MSDAACFSFILNVAYLVAVVVFYRVIVQAANAVIVLSCAIDHSHGQPHAFKCACPCHIKASR
jgi:hypothetical protein